MQCNPDLEDLLTYETPDGDRAHLSFIEPREVDDLRRRGAAFAAWAEVTGGLMGRAPDYMNACMMAIGNARHIWGMQRPGPGRGGLRHLPPLPPRRRVHDPHLRQPDGRPVHPPLRAGAVHQRRHRRPERRGHLRLGGPGWSAPWPRSATRTCRSGPRSASRTPATTSTPLASSAGSTTRPQVDLPGQDGRRAVPLRRPPGQPVRGDGRHRGVGERLHPLVRRVHRPGPGGPQHGPARHAVHAVARPPRRSSRTWPRPASCSAWPT